MLTYRLKGKLWLYPGGGGWHFITLPKRQAAEIKGFFAGPGRRGWGSVRVKATIGETGWETSIFPDSKSSSYLLPVKAAVRKSEGLVEGATVAFTLEIAG